MLTNLICILSQIGDPNDKHHYEAKKNYDPANFHLHTSCLFFFFFFVQDENSTEFVFKIKYGHKSLKN